MAKISKDIGEVVTKVVTYEPVYTLHLSKKELDTIYLATGSIGGSDIYGFRNAMNTIYGIVGSQVRQDGGVAWPQGVSSDFVKKAFTGGNQWKDH